MENRVPENLLEAPIRPQGIDKPVVSLNPSAIPSKYPSNDRIVENITSNSRLDGCANNASILLEPSEYFFDDDFAVPFDATLRDECSLHQQGVIEDSDEGISSSGTINRALLAPPHSRSDSCLFTQPDSGECGHSSEDSPAGRQFESSIIPAGKHSSSFSPQNVCFPDSTSAPESTPYIARIHRTVSADFSVTLHDIGGMDKLFDNWAITFNESHQPLMNAPSSVTGSLMQAMLEGSCCPRLKELLKRTAEALDYRLAWGEIQFGVEEGALTHPTLNTKKVRRIQRSTSHGNIFTAASLGAMRRALANVRIVAPKTYRSIGVSTSECSCGESSLPDTTTATATTTWARIRSSRESLSSRKSTLNDNGTVIPSPPKPTKPNVPDSVVTWRAVKEIAGSELTTWSQLRRTASLGTRKTQKIASKQKDPQNMHASLMHSQLEIPFRPVSQKAMHRYSGTLLEIFMRARARDLVSSSCLSSTGADLGDGEGPSLLKGQRVKPGGNNVSTNFSLQTNPIMLSLGTGTENAGSVDERSNEAFLKTEIPPPKVSQPPPAPLRKSYVNSPRRLLFVNRSGGICFASRLNPDLPDSNLLTMSADPESECMSRLREASYLPHIKNPRAAIVYPGLGKLGIPKPSRIESNTFLSQTLPDLSLLGKAAEQEVKSGTPMTRVPTSSHVSRRAVSVAPVSGRTAGVLAVSGRGNVRNDRNSKLEAIRQRMNGFNAHRASDVVNDIRLADILAKRSQSHVGVVDRSASEPDVVDSQNNPALAFMASSLTKVHKLQRSPGDILGSSRPGLQQSHCKKSVSFNGNIHRLSEGANFCRSPDANRFGSPDPKVIPKNWGLYGQDPPPLAIFQPSSDDTNGVSSTTRPSDVDVRYHAMVMDVIRAVQETVAYFCHSTLPLATPDGSNTTGSSSSSANSKPSHNHYRCYSSLAALGGSGRSSLAAVVNPLMVLISDGLLPPQTRAIFTSKPKSRIWALVEDSCRPSSYLGKIQHHILNEALNQVKSITGAISEKLRFRAFVCACLNQRALLLWLNALVNNDALLKRYYCDGAFIRQCRSTLQGLYADLTTHVEQLLNYPFNFDLAAEVKRPSGHVYNGTTPLASVNGSKSDARKVDQSKGGPEVKDTRTNFGRASSTPACTKALNPKTSSNEARPSSVSKAADTKMVRPRVQPMSRRTPMSPVTLDNQDPKESGSPFMVGPLKPIPFSSPSASVMRGKLRTAFSTFRRSTDIATPVTHPSPPLLAPKCSSPPPPPPHRTALLSNSPIHYDTTPMRVFHPTPPF